MQNPGTLNIVPSKQIANFLLDIGAVKFNIQEPFKWTSGIKSPIYCDNRIINSKVEIRSAVISEFCNIILKNFLSYTDIIAGVSTGGIPYGVLIADRLGLPFIYVRSERKEYGLKKMVEGDYIPGQRVILIEDHISTGISSLRAIEGLQHEGLQLICLLSIMTYSFKAAEKKYNDRGILHASICNLDTILEVAQERGDLSAADVSTILNFRESPEDWGN